MYILIFISSKLNAKIRHKIFFSIIGNIYITNDKIENVYMAFYTPMYFAKLHELLGSIL